MKRHIFLLIAILVPSIKMLADDTLFTYPSAPDSMTTMEQRCSYVVQHFWDRCNINHAFTVKPKLKNAFNDYLDIIPYANAQVVHESVANLIEKVSKNPQNLLTLAEMAEGALYSDTARIVCDEVYYHFAKAVADNKKIKSAEKARFAAQAKILGACQVGMKAPDFTFTTVDGTKQQFSQVPPGNVILFFNDPDCSDCLMARVRLSADYNINQFVKKGQLHIVSIYPGDPNDTEWKEAAKRLPDNWIVGACDNVDTIYDMRNQPVIYYLSNKHDILSKTMTVDQLIEAFRAINTRSE